MNKDKYIFRTILKLFLKFLFLYATLERRRDLCMMDMYDMIFKRKSFHLFRGTERNLTEEELKEIQDFLQGCKPLLSDIRVESKVVPASQTSCKRGAEYCILFYSEERQGYLENIGYIGQQLDLYLASKGIGSLWYGIAKEPDNEHGLRYTIMLAIAKMDSTKFRTDICKVKRKPLKEIRSGTWCDEILNSARFAPSACNSQPWYVVCEEQSLSVFRRSKIGRIGIMPAEKVSFYNQIDMGIFLYILELCLNHAGLPYMKSCIFGHTEKEMSLTARYRILESCTT